MVLPNVLEFLRGRQWSHTISLHLLHVVFQVLYLHSQRNSSQADRRMDCFTLPIGLTETTCLPLKEDSLSSRIFQISAKMYYSLVHIATSPFNIFICPSLILAVYLERTLVRQNLGHFGFKRELLYLFSHPYFLRSSIISLRISISISRELQCTSSISIFNRKCTATILSSFFITAQV